MAPGDIVQIFIVIILLLLSAFFSSAETALTTVNRVRMRTLADDGNKKAQRVLDITDNKAKMLSAILIGNNVVNLSASSLLTTLATNLFGSQWIALSTGVLTFLILILGEGLSLLARINTQQEQEAHSKFVHNENHRCEYPHKSRYDSAVGKRNLLCLEGGEGLR